MVLNQISLHHFLESFLFLEYLFPLKFLHNQKQNQDRFAFEKDQLERGQNQDRLKKVIEDTTAKTSELQDKADQRERSNGKLLKALASF